MKQYFIIAALLGVIAFASVSFLAQADEQQGNVMVKEKAVAKPAAPDPSDGEAAAEKAAAADKDATYKKCMTDKGHTDPVDDVEDEAIDNPGAKE